MDHDHLTERFEDLKGRYDALHRPGATRRLKDELDLGSGLFNDRLTTDEVEELIQELEARLSRTA